MLLGETLHAVDINGANALFYALEANSLAIFKLLRSYRLDVHMRTCAGKTLLYLAVEGSRAHFIHILMDCGIDPELKDIEGETALERLELLFLNIPYSIVSLSPKAIRTV